ncbi:MAG: leucine-rich repeat domain-containing protein, partial [Ruminococcus sp.]|nr:leucine-rich repeat domain-containing protein [Ruminococcus sp.]
MKSTKLLAALLSLTVAAGASVPMGSYVPKHSLTASAESEGSTVNTDELVFKVYADHAEVSGVSNNDLVKCTIPSTVNKVPVTAIAENAFYFSEKLSEVTIPASVSAIGDNAFSWCTDLRAIKVDSANKNFTDVDGVLFSKSKDTIIVYPAGKEGKTYEIADSVKKIASFAFYMSRYIESVKVPESVAYIGQEAFCTCPKLTSVTILDPECKFEYISFICNGKDDKGFSYFNGTLYGYSGSTTEEIAEENNIKFVALDTPAPVTTTTTSTTTTATTTKAATTSTATTTKAATTSTATTTKAAATSTATTTKAAATSTATTTKAATTSTATTTKAAATST